MNGKVVLSFILGAAGGAVGMYFGMKQACEVYIDKEIEQFKADYEAAHEQKPEEKSEDLKDIDENLESCHKGLYVIGDGSGVTHSLSHASASGVYVARHIIEEA